MLQVKDLKTNDKLILNNQEYIFNYAVEDTYNWHVYAHTDKEIIKIADTWKSKLDVQVFRNSREKGWKQL